MLCWDLTLDKQMSFSSSFTLSSWDEIVDARDAIAVRVTASFMAGRVVFREEKWVELGVHDEIKAAEQHGFVYICTQYR